MNFFDINDPKIQSRLIAENDLAFTFPTRTPIVPGHTLVCPKRSVAKFDELTEDELVAIFDLANLLKQALIKTFNAKGFNYAWNEERVAGQSLPHFHLHVVPRVINDAGITDYDPRKFLYRPGAREASPETELSDVAESIKNNL